MGIIVIIAIAIVICWISFLFERAYKYRLDIDYKMLLAENNQVTIKPADEILEELDNANWFNEKEE